MGFLIDTDVCSAHLRKTPQVSSRLIANLGQLHLSVLTLGELLSWTMRDNSPPKYHRALSQFLTDVSILEIDHHIAQRFGEIRAGLLDQGISVSSIDLFIGATALTHGLTVVTHNVRHFSKIPGLLVEDWIGSE